jgi:hypothetical protein
VRFGYVLYPFGLLGWLALTREIKVAQDTPNEALKFMNLDVHHAGVWWKPGFIPFPRQGRDAEAGDPSPASVQHVVGDP